MQYIYSKGKARTLSANDMVWNSFVEICKDSKVPMTSAFTFLIGTLNRKNMRERLIEYHKTVGDKRTAHFNTNDVNFAIDNMTLTQLKDALTKRKQQVVDLLVDAGDSLDIA
jgi:hypothetical protein